jgi:hypothetical protein
LVRSPLYTNDRKTVACGSQKTPSIVPTGYRQRRGKKTKKRKKGMSKENAEEDQKKIISTGSNRPFDYSLGTALTTFYATGGTTQTSRARTGSLSAIT